MAIIHATHGISAALHACIETNPMRLMDTGCMYRSRLDRQQQIALPTASATYSAILLSGSSRRLRIRVDAMPAEIDAPLLPRSLSLLLLYLLDKPCST